MNQISNDNPPIYRATITMGNGGKVECTYHAKAKPSFKRITDHLTREAVKLFPDDVFAAIEIEWLRPDGSSFKPIINVIPGGIHSSVIYEDARSTRSQY